MTSAEHSSPDEAAVDTAAEPTEANVEPTDPAPPRTLEQLVTEARQEILDNLPAAPGQFRLPPADNSKALPEWVKLPQKFTIPKGKQVVFIQCLKHLTDRPDKGNRCLVLWPLTSMDEKLAAERAETAGSLLQQELAKGQIRAVDGHRADWGGLLDNPGNIDQVWDEIGSKYRQQIIRTYVRMHTFTAKEQIDFFDSCITVRSMG